VNPELRLIGNDHRAACHYAEEAQQSDVGVAHIATETRVSPPQPEQPAVAASSASSQTPVRDASGSPIADPS
jgi:hypothetical protein